MTAPCDYQFSEHRPPHSSVTPRATKCAWGFYITIPGGVPLMWWHVTAYHSVSDDLRFPLKYTAIGQGEEGPILDSPMQRTADPLARGPGVLTWQAIQQLKWNTRQYFSMLRKCMRAGEKVVIQHRRFISLSEVLPQVESISCAVSSTASLLVW